jgi:poly(3-hydroxybutyrate) depolymerase
LIGAAAILVAVVATSAVAAAMPPTRPGLAATPVVRVWTIHYVAHDGRLRRALIELPGWYGPDRDPAIPLIISPHGRGIPAWATIRRWGDLPAIGNFAVVHPEGQGRRLALFAWGDPGDVSDLAKMPKFVERALPWLHIDRRRVYAFGGSMGGQETLLLVARHPHLLAGAAAFDAPTNMAARYHAFPFLPSGRRLQRLARIEIGGTPASDPRAYALRSPLDWAKQIAFSGVPLQIWWSTRDTVVTDQAHESGLLYKEIKRLNPYAPVSEYVGTWGHVEEMRAATRLPLALGDFHLIPHWADHYDGGVPRVFGRHFERPAQSYAA